MPTYEYECRSCDQVFEVFQSMRDAPLSSCPQCGQHEVKRLIGRGAGIIFKGSGFYETDYKRPQAKEETESASSSGDTKPVAAPASNKTDTSSSGSSSGTTSSPSGGGKAN